MSIVEAIFLGIIQGLTEFIPVSSSGHLLLAQETLGNSNTLLFDVMLHVGTLCALIVYFHKDLYSLAKNVFRKNTEGKLARLIALATLPAVAAGLLLGDFIEESLRSPLVVVVTLSVVAILMLIAEKYNQKNSEEKITSEREIDTKQAMRIGVAQALALVPGVSRSGITITVGMLAGLSRQTAARFSFLLAMPIIAGSALGTYISDTDALTFDAALFAGLLAAFLSGLLAIKFLLAIIGRVGLKPFAYYRLALALIVLLIIL